MLLHTTPTNLDANISQSTNAERIAKHREKLHAQGRGQVNVTLPVTIHQNIREFAKRIKQGMSETEAAKLLLEELSRSEILTNEIPKNKLEYYGISKINSNFAVKLNSISYGKIKFKDCGNFSTPKYYALSQPKINNDSLPRENKTNYSLISFIDLFYKKIHKSISFDFLLKEKLSYITSGFKKYLTIKKIRTER